MRCVYTMEYDSAIKRNGIKPSAPTGLDPEILLLSEVSHTEKGNHL